MSDLPRALPALITAMHPDGAIDVDGHRHNIATMSDRGARGVLLAGSTGEGPYLEPGERRILIEAAREVDQEMAIICGVHAESTREALRAVEECAPADLVLVVTPTSLVRGRADAVEQFYRDVADASPIRLLLYSVPSVTGWELPTESVEVLAAHPSIVGMKDSGGDPSRITELGSTIEQGFVIYAGASRALAESSRRGAWGAITASANYALADVSLAARGDDQAQRRLTQLSTAVERHGLSGSKVAAASTGLAAGPARLPVLPLSDAAVEDVESALRNMGVARPQ